MLVAPATMTAADSLKKNPGPPRVRYTAFCLLPPHLHDPSPDNFWALRRCALLPSRVCLLCSFCSSVQALAVWLTSDLGLLPTSLPLVEQSEIPIHGASASSLPKRAGDFHSLVRFLQVLYVSWSYPVYHSGHTHLLSPILIIFEQEIAWSLWCN